MCKKLVGKPEHSQKGVITKFKSGKILQSNISFLTFSFVEDEEGKLRGSKGFGELCLPPLAPVSTAGTYNHRCSQGAMPSQIFRISSYFVLGEAVSQTKYCCSPKVKHFVSPNFWLAITKTSWTKTRMFFCWMAF